MDRGYITNKLAKDLQRGTIIKDCDMRKYTSFKAGGRAAIVAIPESQEELQVTLHTLARLTESGAMKQYMVIGNGSNVLVRDGGYDGVIVKLGEAFGSIQAEGERLVAGAAALLATAARAALAAELTGLEFASGIPGSIGGAAFMNAGAYNGEISQIIEEVTVIDKTGSSVRTLKSKELNLAYRYSSLQETKEIVTSVILKLKKGDKDQIAEKMRALLAQRNEKQPIHLPSAGSFFKRPPGHFAGGLIEEAGLKGLTLGDAQVSPLHAGFIVNNGKATATEIINLMELVQNTVYDKTGVRLEPEVRIIGE